MKVGTKDREGTWHNPLGRAFMPRGEGAFDLAAQVQADPQARAALEKVRQAGELARLKEESIKAEKRSKRCAEASQRRWKNERAR